MIFRLALRNALRDRRRSALTGGMIACSVALLIVGLSWVDGLLGLLVESLLEEYGQVRVVHAGYVRRERTFSLGYAIHPAPAVAEGLRAIPGAARCLERIKFAAMVDREGTHQEPALVFAVDPARESGFGPLGPDLVLGRAIRESANEVVVGRSLAARLGITVGDAITLVASDRHRCLRGCNVRVVGVFSRGSDQLDRRLVMPLSAARTFLDMAERATEVVVFADGVDAVAMARAVRARAGVPDVTVQDWREASGLGGILHIADTVMAILALILAAVAALGVTNTMLMAVLERTREIGLLGALGLRSRQILAIFLCEAVVLGILGGTVGAALGVGGASYLCTHGVAIQSKGLEGLPVPAPDQVKGRLRPRTVALSWALGVAVALAASFWPALVAARLDPVRALRK